MVGEKGGPFQVLSHARSEEGHKQDLTGWEAGPLQSLSCHVFLATFTRPEMVSKLIEVTQQVRSRAGI